MIVDASLEEMQDHQGERSPGAPRSPGRGQNKARFSADIEYLMRQHKVYTGWTRKHDTF